MFDWHANSALQQIKAQEQAIVLRQRAVEILKDYEFKADKVVQRVYNFTQQAGGSSATVFGFGG